MKDFASVQQDTLRQVDRVGGWFARHLFTVFAGAAMGVVLLCVPQINHVIVQLPWFDHAGVFEVLVLWSYLVALLLLFVVLWRWSLPRTVAPVDGGSTPTVTFPDGGADPAQPPTRRGRLALACRKFPALLTRFAASRTGRVRLAMGGVLLVVAAVWWSWSGLGVGSRFTLEYGSRAALALQLALIGAWLIGFARRHPGTGDAPWAVAVGGRALWLLLCTWGLGEVLWRWSHDYLMWSTPRAYTLWALTQVAFLLVLVARVIDALHVAGWRRLRWFAAGVGALYFALLGAEPVGSQGQRPADATPAETTWFTALAARLDAIPEGEPVVIVAASGGGSRAALFAGLVYERLASLPVREPEPGKLPKTFADHVLFISSVSGGSLASAYQFYTPRAAAGRLLASPRNSFHDELLDRMVLIVREMLERSPGNGPGAAPGGSSAAPRPAPADGLRAVLEGLLADLLAEQRHDDTQPAAADGVPDDVRVAVHGRFADDMATDFMAPMLRGVLLPGIERGTRLADFWRDRFGWSGVHNLGAARADRPLLVLNSTDTGRGVRLAIGFPALPRGLLGETMSALADVAPGWQVDLAQAVRLSANFPWGLQVAELDTGEPAAPPPPWVPPLARGYQARHAWELGDRSQIKVLDGGLIDNTGIDTVARVFERLRQIEAGHGRAPTDGQPWTPEQRQQVERLQAGAVTVLHELRRRKVLLIEIDAGRKFQTDGALSRWLPTLFSPLSSLEAAAHVNALLRKEAHMRTLADVLDGEVDQKDRIARFASVPFVCNRDDDVMTAWALGSQDKASVMVQFLTESRMQAEVLRSTFASLAGGTKREALSRKQDEIDAEAMVRQERYDVRQQQAPPPSAPPPAAKEVKQRVHPRGIEWKK